MEVTYVTYQPPASFIYQQTSHEENLAKEICFSEWKEKQSLRRQEYTALLEKQIWTAPSSEEIRYQDEQAEFLGRWVHAALAYIWQYPQQGIEKALLVSSETGASVQATEQAREILSAFLRSGLFEKLRAMQVLGVEMPFVQKTQEGLVSGVMDLLLKDKSGNIWVIDFKTDILHGKLPAQAAEKYRPQLSAYRQAVQAIYPQDSVRFAVVFVRSQEMAEL